MKPIGIPRVLDVINPDCEDGKNYAIKPSKLNIQGPGGDYHSNFHNTEQKNSIRRAWKKKDRQAGKKSAKNIEE